ncbi:phosphotransferase enzyme family protein [Streptococcus pyogenes]|uniref:phosphotransferase enzyme family protein n=1 Tax=Streptococcus pyogenes TaxID=1314 RepID=UPI003DA1B76B
MSERSAPDIAQTTLGAAAIARLVTNGYDRGEVVACELLRRGFNHVYALRFANGERAVARLSAERPRRVPNVAYEAALLAHHKAAGCAVAAVYPSREGEPSITVALPEGSNPLVLFEYLEGEPPGDVLIDIEATGRGLALLHNAGEGYQGPTSQYSLDLSHLLHGSLALLVAAPTMTDALRAQYEAVGALVEARLQNYWLLTRVECHGDCHGNNNFMSDGPTATRIASFFDFDDSGPGYLSYDLSVYLWAILPRTVNGVLADTTLERWRSYIRGYQSVRSLAASDFAAIGPFLAVRNLWLLGEYAGRAAVWGTQLLPTPVLRKQVELLAFWAEMTTPE